MWLWSDQLCILFTVEFSLDLQAGSLEFTQVVFSQKDNYFICSAEA